MLAACQFMMDPKNTKSPTVPLEISLPLFPRPRTIQYVNQDKYVKQKTIVIESNLFRFLVVVNLINMTKTADSETRQAMNVTDVPIPYGRNTAGNAIKK